MLTGNAGNELIFEGCEMQKLKKEWTFFFWREQNISHSLRKKHLKIVPKWYFWVLSENGMVNRFLS